MGRNNEYAHRCFDAHVTNFSSGIEKLLAAHAALQKHGISPTVGYLSLKQHSIEDIASILIKKLESS